MNEDPRYAAPAAVVADPADRAGGVPDRVRRAVGLLWTSMALAVPVCVLEVSRDPQYREFDVLVAIVIVYLLLFGLTALLNVKVYRGRNWARVTTFLFTLLGAYFTLSPNDGEVPPSVVESALNIVCMVLECVAMYWLFTLPGADWFRRRD